MAGGLSNSPIRDLSSEQISLRSPAARVSTVDVALLIASGMLATLLMALVHLNLRVPGHAILKPLLPITLGLVLAPRRTAGCIAGLGAAATAGVLLICGWGEIHASALASLILLGPALDVAARGTHARSLLIARCAAAGLLSNMVALGVKLVATPLGWESGGGRGFAALWPYGIVTFAACGLLAGGLSAAICLATHRRADPSQP